MRAIAIVFTIALTFRTGSALLYGCLPPYPDELQYPHIVPPELQFGTYGTKPGDLNGPEGICVSAEGEIYLADTSNNRIQVFSVAGQQLRTWGEAGSVPGKFVAPQAIAVDSHGEVFVADAGNNRIQVFDAAGKPLRQWGAYGDKPGDFRGPCGIAVDTDRVYVVDQGNERLQVFDFNGAPLFELGEYGDGPGKFNQPSDVTVDGEGNLYVADSHNDRIQKFDRLGRFLSSWGGPGSHQGLFSSPAGVCYRGGQIYVADSDNHRIQVFDVEGNFLFQWGRHPSLLHEGQGWLHHPTRIAVAPKGDFAVVLEPFEHRCQVFDSSALVEVEAVNNLAWRDATTGFHAGSRVQGRGSLLTVAEPETHSVLVLDTSPELPKLITKLGGRGREPGRFIGPAGIDVDPDSGDIYVSDGGNSRVQRFGLQRDPGTNSFIPNMNALLKAVDLRTLVRRDREPAVGAIPKPGALKRDSQQNVYIVDSTNARIIVLDKAMNYVRSWGEWGDQEGQFRMPKDLAFNKAEDVLYVTDAYNFRVQAFDKSGKFLFAWGSPGVGPGQFMDAFSVCVGTDGCVFVSDPALNRIQKFDPHGKPLEQWGTWGTQAGQFSQPGGLVQDEKGHIIVVDVGNERFQVFTPDGEFIRMFGMSAACTPVPPSFKANGNDQGARAATVESSNAAGTSVLSNRGTYKVQYRATPTPIPLNQPFDLHISVLDAGGRTLVPGTTVQVDAGMPAHQHGMTQKPIVKVNADGTYTASGLLFHMPGRWQIYFDVSHNGVIERAQSDETLE